MVNKLTATLFLVLCLTFVMPISATRVVEQDRKQSGKEVFSALAELPTSGTTMNVKIYIDGYSSQRDADGLNAILLDGGPKALLKALKKMKPIGRIQREDTIGFYTFKLILSKPTATGRSIYAITDRPIGFLESYFDTRSKDFPFGILQLELKAAEKEKWKGEGTLVYASKIKGLNGEKMDVENFAFAPIRLLAVRQL